jgi:hypothetical protein
MRQVTYSSPALRPRLPPHHLRPVSSTLPLQSSEQALPAPAGLATIRGCVRSAAYGIHTGLVHGRSSEQVPTLCTSCVPQVVSATLRGRLQHWTGVLDTKAQQDPGYFDAPSTVATAKWVGANIPVGSRPFVTFGFCSICPEDAGELPQAMLNAATDSFNGVVRATLQLCGGYECQEKGGTFMLAFKSMRLALEWGMVFQMALMTVGGTWPQTDVNRM